MENDFTGTGVALVTPFKDDLSIDYSALERLLDHVVEGGVDYLVVCGTTGESVTLTRKEKRELLGFVVSNNDQDLPIVFGIGGNNTQSCLEDIDDTDFTGVQAILSVSPYYNKPSQEGIIKHYEKIVDHCPVPLILYNVPGRTSSNLTWKTTAELSKHPKIIGIKEASGDLVQCMKIRSHSSKEFLLISGDDMLTGLLMSIGGAGVISVMANAFPEYFRNMMMAAKNDNFPELHTQIFKLLDINPLMYIEGNPVGVKEVLSQKGICSGNVRLPLISASESLKKEISLALNRLET